MRDGNYWLRITGEPTKPLCSKGLIVFLWHHVLLPGNAHTSHTEDSCNIGDRCSFLGSSRELYFCGIHSQLCDMVRLQSQGYYLFTFENNWIFESFLHKHLHQHPSYLCFSLQLLQCLPLPLSFQGLSIIIVLALVLSSPRWRVLWGLTTINPFPFLQG